MATATGNPIYCTCDGKGEYVVRDEDGFIGSIATHLCACRLSEPPRHSKAAWWTLEGMGDHEFESLTKQHQLTASIRRERPVSEDNHRLIRTPENMYWPTMASLEGDLGGGDWTSDMLRSLAKWLTQVADDVDRIDAEIS